MKLTIDITKIPEEEKSELVVLLLEVIRQQAEIIQELRDEIARLKGHNPRPKIEPSRMEPLKKEKPEGGNEKRPGSDKRQKSAQLVIVEEIKVPAVDVPQGSVFKGYKDFIVQDLHIRSHNTKYLLECWQKPEGGHIIAEPPAELGGKHFGMELIRFILYQYRVSHRPARLLYRPAVAADAPKNDITRTENRRRPAPPAILRLATAIRVETHTLRA